MTFKLFEAAQWPEHQTCATSGKAIYHDADDANTELRRLYRTLANATEKGSRLHVYRCDHCGGLHIGHRRRGRRARLPGE